jgi:hypothetical protein
MHYHQRMEKLLLIVFGPLIFAVVLLLLVTGVRRAITTFTSRLSPEELKAAREAYSARLQNPQSTNVERELGKLLPERLLKLYENKSAILSGGFLVEKPGKKRWRAERWPVYCFEPMDTDALNELPYEDELGPGFCFATTGRRCWYWIAASDQRTMDSPVIFLDYDGGRSHGKKVADTLEEFLNWPHLPMK